MNFYTLPRNINYYIIPRLGNGTSDDPYKPDIPDGFSFVSADCLDGEYLVFTSTELPGKLSIPHQDLENICNEKGITYDDVMKWKV